MSASWGWTEKDEANWESMNVENGDDADNCGGGNDNGERWEWCKWPGNHSPSTLASAHLAHRFFQRHWRGLHPAMQAMNIILWQPPPAWEILQTIERNTANHREKYCKPSREILQTIERNTTNRSEKYHILASPPSLLEAKKPDLEEPLACWTPFKKYDCKKYTYTKYTQTNFLPELDRYNLSIFCDNVFIFQKCVKTIMPHNSCCVTFEMGW